MEIITAEHSILRSPLWLRLLLWLGTPFVFICGAYVLAIPFIFNNYQIVTIASILLLGGFPIYICFQALKALPYIKAVIEFNSRGFNISWPDGMANYYSWQSVGELNHYATAEVLEVKDYNGNRILAVSEKVINYHKFVSIALIQTELKL